MAEIWVSKHIFKMIEQISSLYLLYFKSYERFSVGNFNDLHRKFRNFESASDKELKFGMLKHLEKVYLGPSGPT